MSRPRSNSIAPNRSATPQARARPTSASVIGRVSAGADRPPAGVGRERFDAVAVDAALEHAAAAGQIGDEAHPIAGDHALLDADRAAAGGDGAAQLLVILPQLEAGGTAVDGQRPAAGEAGGNPPEIDGRRAD